MHMNENLRKDFWIKKMDEADVFMTSILDYPVLDDLEPLVSLRDAASAENVEVIFSERRHNHNLPRLFYLRKELIPNFIAAARDLNQNGLVLKVEDGFRTRDMQGFGVYNDAVFRSILNKVQWECGCETPPTDLLYRRTGALVALYPKVGTHMSGTAMDISVLNADTGEEVDRGAPYLEMSELTPMDSPFISDKAKNNRVLITNIMNKHGFSAYPWEFWHYNAKDAHAELLGSKRPAKYGAVDLDIETGNVTPLENPTKPLVSKDFVLQRMNELLNR